MVTFIDVLTSEISSFWKSLLQNFPEWCLTVIVVIGSVLLCVAVEPRHDRAVFENFNERYPYSGETIGVVLLFIIIIVIPCAILGFIALIRPRKLELAFAYMSLAQVLGLTLFVTEILKIMVARPRPNYFSYVKFDPASNQATAPKSHQKDAKVSFPSGHASNAFACGTWISLFLSQLHHGQELWWILLVFLPVGIATYIASTRITDYMHHVSDVVAGALLGIGVAVVVFQAQAGRILLQQKKMYDPYAQL
jgi:membrane-associated phospholipid phosphatase